MWQRTMKAQQHESADSPPTHPDRSHGMGPAHRRVRRDRTHDRSRRYSARRERCRHPLLVADPARNHDGSVAPDPRVDAT